MLSYVLPKVGDSAFVKLLDGFFRSKYYIIVITAAMALANIFALELAVYYLFLLCVVLAAFFASDMRGVVPLACCGYMTVSAANNPAGDTQSLFHQPQFQAQFLFIVAAMVIVLLGRLVFDLVVKQERRKMPRLLCGFLFLGIAYVIAGAFSEFYGGKNAIYGAVQIIALSVFYFYFFYTVDWKSVDEGYVAELFTIVGAGMVAEIIGLYFLPGVVGEGGVINRGAMVTGWGVYNNVGCVMAMCMPAPFYLAVKHKQGWIFTVLGSVYMLAVVLTQSRGSIFFGAIVYALCLLFTLVAARGAKEKVLHCIVIVAMAAAIVSCWAVFREQFQALFNSLILVGDSDSGRFDIYRRCWEQFVEHPWFGVGFFDTKGYAWGMLPEGSFLVPRAHNTYIQLLASGGVFAMIAYAYHRGETLWLLFRHPSAQKTAVCLCMLSLILTSVLDCNFFNFGPGLLYSVLLVFAEGGNLRSDKACHKN